MSDYSISVVHQGDWRGDDAQYEYEVILFAGYRVLTERGWEPLEIDDSPMWQCVEGAPNRVDIHHMAGRLVRGMRIGEFGSGDKFADVGVDVTAFDVPSWWGMLSGEQQEEIVERWLSETPSIVEAVYWDTHNEYDEDEWDDEGDYIG